MERLKETEFIPVGGKLKVGFKTYKAACFNGEEVEVSFLANLFKLVVDGLLIWWLVESFKY